MYHYNSNPQSTKKRYAVSQRRKKERGFVLVVLALGSIALLGALGLAVDVGKMFVVKKEAQAFCDAAALGAALALDGTTTGISSAQAVVATSLNKWDLNNSTVPNPMLEFATSNAGPWVNNPNPATGYGFARVTVTVSTTLYFVPVVNSKTSQAVTASATAAQVDLTSFPRGLAPYTAIAQNATGPTFGLNIGDSYDIQWPNFDGTRNGCGAANPNRCFVSPPCTGDSTNSKSNVVRYWGSSNSGYWGSSSNSIIQQQILDVIQIQPVTVGTNIFPVLTNGNKASEAGYLDQRASQDTNTTDNTVAAYLASIHNGRRLIPAPIVNPTSTSNTSVVGYGQFLLMANGPGTSNYYVRTTNGNDPYCAIYAGPYVIGGAGPGVGGTTGASQVKLIQ